MGSAGRWAIDIEELKYASLAGDMGYVKTMLLVSLYRGGNRHMQVSIATSYFDVPV
jgi:hypothetical protein